MRDRRRVMTEAADQQAPGSDVVSLEEISTALESSPNILAIAEQKAEETALRRSQMWRGLSTIVVVALLLSAAAFLIDRSVYAKGIVHAQLWYIVLAGILGATVGTSELVSRYRDEPSQALRSPPALMYLILNALVSVSVYALLTHYGRTLIPALANDPLMRSITAGFGAMAILRSKFFTLRTEKGEDIGIGPDAAIAAFLSAADRGVDRARAKRRLDLVFKSASKVPPVDYIKDFVKVSLLSFQNLSDGDKRDINDKIDAIYKDDSIYSSDELKLQAMCYAVLIIVGEYNFNRLMKNLVDFIGRRQQGDTHRKDLAKKTSEEFIDQLRQARPARQAQPRNSQGKTDDPDHGSTGPNGVAEPIEPPLAAPRRSQTSTPVVESPN